MNASVIVLLLFPATLCSQILIEGLGPGGTRRLLPVDAAALDIRETLTSLPCAVTPIRPELGYDLVFRAGFEARIRRRDLAGDGNTLTTIFRVTSVGDPNRPVYFEQKWGVPPIEENAGGAASLQGTFKVGEGDYHVDW